MKSSRHAKKLLGCFSALAAIFLLISTSYAQEWWEESLAREALNGDTVAIETVEAMLYGAAFGGDASKVRYLLEKGVNVNARARPSMKGEISSGVTALITASVRGHLDTVQVLLEHGADVNAQDNTGSTALILAACYGHADIVRALLDHGADPNVHKEGSTTALMYACSYCSVDMVRMLLDKGADVNAKGSMGEFGGMQTALSIAKGFGYSEIVEILKEKGAKE